MSDTGKLSLKECEPIAKEATRQRLQDCQLPEGLRDNLVLGSSLEGEYCVFELYEPGERPEQGKVISRAKVCRQSGQCEVELFLPPKS